VKENGEVVFWFEDECSGGAGGAGVGDECLDEGDPVSSSDVRESSDEHRRVAVAGSKDHTSHLSSVAFVSPPSSPFPVNSVLDCNRLFLLMPLYILPEVSQPPLSKVTVARWATVAFLHIE